MTFNEKGLSILVSHSGGHRIITKGALINILEICNTAKSQDGSQIEIEKVRDQILQRYETLGAKGYRILGIAVKEIGEQSKIEKLEEKNMVFLGMLSFYDPPKTKIKETITNLKKFRSYSQSNYRR
ncbi:Magnesium transport P-type atpase [Leptospira interrogans serovar Canicola]|nr:Magnesium transport P-type atpase [Leptospira interrogans serovar Canicola]